MNEIKSIKHRFSGLFYASVLGMTLLLPSLVFATGPVIRSGDMVAVEANQVLEGNFYGFGETVTLSGAAERDVYVAGGSVTINAPVAEDLVIVGGSVQVHGEVMGDVRVIGGEVVIAKAVAGDVAILGGTVRILSTATIKGDLIFLTGDVHVDGRVEGAVYGTAEFVRINTAVLGDVTVHAGESFTLGDMADVGGNIVYTSRNDLTRGQGAVVNGTISRETIVEKAQMTNVQGTVLLVLVLVFSSLAAFFIARARVERLVIGALSTYGRSGLIGLGMLIAIPIVAIILMSSIIGVVVGMALMLLYALIMMVSCMLFPIYVGAFFEQFFGRGRHVSFLTILFGIALTVAFMFTPIIGGFIIFLMVTVVFGALCLELYRVFRTV